MRKRHKLTIGRGSSRRKISHDRSYLSALRKLYPRKPESWYQRKAFLKSPRGTALYWKKVLAQKAKAWRKEHELEHKKAQKRKAFDPDVFDTPVLHRIKDKLSHRSKSTTVMGSPRDGRKSTPIVIGTESSNSEDSDSQDDSRDAVLPTQSEPAAAAARSPEPKLAPGPETYTRGEMKTFARMAATINNVDVTKGHSSAVADFIDSEFLDNSEMMNKARRAPKESWRKRRFNTACEKAAKITEERYACMHACPSPS